MCPICFRSFSEKAIENKQITIEDIIPSSIKKSFLTLTCKDCNNLGGTILDSHLANRFKHEDILAGKDMSPLRGKLIIDSEHITADIYLPSDADPNIKVVGIPELSDPQKVQRINEKFDAGAESFQITGELGYRDLPSRISILKIAYLMAFSCFGYGYIKYNFLDPVRRQIMNSTEETEVMKGVVKLDFPILEKSCVTVLKEPGNLKCFFVSLNLSTKQKRFVGVVLPGFDEANIKIYARWASIDYTDISMKSVVVKPVPYYEDFLINQQYKHYAIAAWKILQNPT